MQGDTVRLVPVKGRLRDLAILEVDSQVAQRVHQRFQLRVVIAGPEQPHTATLHKPAAWPSVQRSLAVM